MKKLKGHTLLIFLSTVVFQGTCQADPFWLKSWEEANKNKPEFTPSSSRIAAKDEPGIPFVINGKVYKPDGSLAEGVLVHAYHRDKDGFDFGSGDNSFTTWRLQGWAKTDSEGRFTFQTIRPAADHLGREGAHIHLTMISADCGRQWAPTVYLADDPMVSENQREKSLKAGEFGFVREVIKADGVQKINVKIRLKPKGDF